MNIRDIVALAPVIPELAFNEISQALPVARALCAGGLRVLEISLRTGVGLASIEAIRKGLPDAIVGAGGLTRAVDFAAADRAGAQFGATPGLTAELAAASRGARFPVMPGVMTPTEVISARIRFSISRRGVLRQRRSQDKRSGLFVAGKCGMRCRKLGGSASSARAGRLAGN